MTVDIDILESLPAQLRYEIIEDISHRGDKQSVLARKQRKAIEFLQTQTHQGVRNDLLDKNSCTSNPVQVSRRANTTEKVAKLYGEGEAAVRQRIYVLNGAEEDPEKWGSFHKQMDEEESPHGAFQRLREAQRAERIRGEVKSEPGESTVRRGEIWIMGDHRLMCGDATTAIDVNRLFAGAKPHLMVTDPPFGVNYDPKWRAAVLGPRRISRGVLNDDRADWRDAFALFSGDVAYVFHSRMKSDVVIAGLESVGFERRTNITWVKPQFVIDRGHYHSQYEPCWYAVRRGQDAHWNGGRDKSDVWKIARSRDRRDDWTSHGTQKPVECMFRPIENSSQPGDAVYDPFVGSGTTIIAAEIANRRCHAMDIDPVYCTVAVERWQNFTGRQAVLEVSGQAFNEVKGERLRNIEESSSEQEPESSWPAEVISTDTISDQLAESESVGQRV
jgi:DNA modification methylase